jgi:hypothetical protein
MDMPKVAAQLRELLRNPGTQKDLGRLARNLGHELPHNPLQELRQFQAAVAETYQAFQQSPAREAGFAAGVLFALMEVCAGYDAENGELEDQRALDAFLRQSLPQAILQRLWQRSGSLEDLEQTLGEPCGQVSRTLEQLQIAGLVEPENPARPEAGGRSFRLTPDGYRRTKMGAGQGV